MSELDEFGGRRIQTAPTGGSSDEFGGKRVAMGTAGSLDNQGAQGGPVSTGFMDTFTGADRIEATPELGTLPRFATTPEGGGELSADSLRMTVGLLSTFDEKAQRDIISEFIPEASFETTRDGSTIINVPTEEGVRRSVLNRPGFSAGDAITGITQMLAFVPAARISAMGKTLAQKVGFGAAASGATEQALQETGIALGREERDPAATALAAGLGGGAEMAGAGLRRFADGRKAKGLAVEASEVADAEARIAPIREAQQAVADATGSEVGLFPAQQTQQPSALIKQRLLPQLEAGSRKAAEALERQNGEVFEATMRMIDTIAPESATDNAAERFRSAAARAIDARKQARAAAASPLYREAFAKALGSELDTTEALKPVHALVDDILRSAPSGSSFERVGGKLARLLSDKTGPVDLERLQKARFEMTDMINASEASGKAVSSHLKRDITLIKQELTAQMRALSPEFAAADDVFESMSPAVSELENGIVGRISRVKDDQLQRITNMMFEPGMSGVGTVTRVKDLLDHVDPGVWDDVLRLEFSKRVDGLQQLVADSPEQLAGNLPAKLLNTVYRNPNQRRMLLHGMEPNQRQNFLYLEKVLRAAASGRAAGSPTASFQAAMEKMRGVSAVLRDTLFRPLQTLQGVGEKSLFDHNVAALTDIMFNPKWEPAMKRVRELPLDSKEAERIMADLIASVKASGQLTRDEND